MMRSLLALLLLGVWLAVGGPARADAPDPRFVVELQADPEAGLELAELHADIRAAVRKALPLLWRRVLPAEDQANAPSPAGAIRLLRRATPTPSGVRVEFDKARVRAMVEQAGLGFIPEAPRWSVTLRLTGLRGGPMPGVAAALRDRLATMMPSLGIVPDPAGATLKLHWQWLGPRQAALRVRGETPLDGMAETRFLPSGDPLPELARWMEDALLRVRDAAAVRPREAAPAAALPAPVAALPADAYAALAGDAYAAAAAPDPLALELTVEGGAGLADQVMFEEALRGAPEVVSLVPVLLSPERRVYRIRLRRPGDGWLEEWLRGRGFLSRRDERGWLAWLP
ncbi:MAG: hypothetical protein R8K47_04700 [Mariprofundaceae bacterium]